MKDAAQGRAPSSVASAIMAVLLIVGVALAAVAAAVYATDVAHQVAGLQDALDRNVHDNCLNTTRRAAYPWINDHCVRFEREHRVGLSRKAMDIVVGDCASILFIVMTEYQLFDANYIKVLVLVVLLLGFYLVRDSWFYAWMWAMYKGQPRSGPQQMLMARQPAAFMQALPTAASEGFAMGASVYSDAYA